MLIPQDNRSYYSVLEPGQLYQGDIIDARLLGVKDEDQPTSPDYWLLITKNCDLVFREEGKPKASVLNLVPLISFRQRYLQIKRRLDFFEGSAFKRFVLVGVLKFSEMTSLMKKDEHVNELISDKFSKLMFLPPDGEVLTEPMIIDFEVIINLDSSDFENVLSGKKLQLASPFRERIAQRFALHFSQIGIEDSEVKQKDYRQALKEHLKASR